VRGREWAVERGRAGALALKAGMGVGGAREGHLGWCNGDYRGKGWMNDFGRAKGRGGGLCSGVERQGEL
jgi:hypothetical protein